MNIAKLIIITGLIFLSSLNTFAQRSARPNVVIVVSDDHRGDLLSCKGHPIIKTPHIDHLAQEGVLFQNAFCVFGVCSPSRATILTGRYAHNAAAPYIVWDNNSFNSQPTFIHELHKNGYYTAHIGKWHLGEGSNPREGYDYWAGFDWLGKFFDTEVTINGITQKFEGFSDDILAKLASDFIDNNATKQQPFALYVGLKSPHMPFSHPQRMNSLYQSDFIPPPLSFEEDYSKSGKTGLIDNFLQFKTAPFGIKGWKTWDYYIKSYYRSTTAIDDAMGVIMNALERNNISGNTIVIYTSDQGYNNGEHGLTEKHFAYEPVMNIPMIIRYPDAIKKTGVKQDLVSTIDINPTLLDLCNIKSEVPKDGKSWKPILLDEKPEKTFREEVFFAYNGHFEEKIPAQLAIRTIRYKLISYQYTGEHELYDLFNDPAETISRAKDIQYADVFEDLRVRLEKWKEQTNWNRRIRENIEKFEVLGSIDSSLSVKLIPLISQSPDAKSYTLEKKKYSFKSYENSSDISNIPGGEKKRIIIKLLISNDHQEDLFTGLFVKPFHPLTGYCNGVRFIEKNTSWAGANYNPPLKTGKNIVLLSLDWSEPSELELSADRPGNWVSINDN